MASPRVAFQNKTYQHISSPENIHELPRTMKPIQSGLLNCKCRTKTSFLSGRNVRIAPNEYRSVAALAVALLTSSWSLQTIPRRSWMGKGGERRSSFSVELLTTLMKTPPLLHRKVRKGKREGGAGGARCTVGGKVTFTRLCFTKQSREKGTRWW